MGKSDTNIDPFVDSTMSLGDHLEELRARLIYAILGLVICTVLCLIFGKYIVTFVKSPYVKIMEELGRDPRLDTLSPAEGFVSYVKVAVVAGLILSCPWIFYHIWMFVAAGLYPHEKKYVYMATPFTAVLFVSGALFFLLCIAPLALKYFIRVNDWLGFGSRWTFPFYLSFVSHLMLVFGIAFQTPVAIFILNRCGLVSAEALGKARRFMILAIVVVAAVATPGPDVVSQIALAVPLYALYELGIFLCYFADRRKRRFENN